MERIVPAVTEEDRQSQHGTKVEWPKIYDEELHLNIPVNPRAGTSGRTRHTGKSPAPNRDTQRGRRRFIMDYVSRASADGEEEDAETDADAEGETEDYELQIPYLVHHVCHSI
ncbi:hypothetical protein MVEN_00022400 [Mycena venus]|uniref:Uncharacterized protein n=1 Tax=Mycena venus TaxID=2733690 RepID=A0A8H7DDP3_9AGAR|nr:hypothetical protein MVEN_00022400 [Mycena venus]